MGQEGLRSIFENCLRNSLSEVLLIYSWDILSPCFFAGWSYAVYENYC